MKKIFLLIFALCCLQSIEAQFDLVPQFNMRSRWGNPTWVADSIPIPYRFWFTDTFPAVMLVSDTEIVDGQWRQSPYARPLRGYVNFAVRTDWQTHTHWLEISEYLNGYKQKLQSGFVVFEVVF